MGFPYLDSPLYTPYPDYIQTHAGGCRGTGKPGPRWPADGKASRRGYFKQENVTQIRRRHISGGTTSKGILKLWKAGLLDLSKSHGTTLPPVVRTTWDAEQRNRKLGCRGLSSTQPRKLRDWQTSLSGSMESAHTSASRMQSREKGCYVACWQPSKMPRSIRLLQHQGAGHMALRASLWAPSHPGLPQDLFGRHVEQVSLLSDSSDNWM
nr:uncharacterized protein LOC105710595 [Aotus nancymaae]